MRTLEVFGPASSFIDEENDPQRDCHSWPEKAQLIRGISVGVCGKLPVLVCFTIIDYYHNLVA